MIIFISILMHMLICIALPINSEVIHYHVISDCSEARIFLRCFREGRIDVYSSSNNFFRSVKGLCTDDTFGVHIHIGMPMHYTIHVTVDQRLSGKFLHFLGKRNFSLPEEESRHTDYCNPKFIPEHRMKKSYFWILLLLIVVGFFIMAILMAVRVLGKKSFGIDILWLGFILLYIDTHDGFMKMYIECSCKYVRRWS